MYYAPHTLIFRHPMAFSKDEFGRPIRGEEQDWEDGGECRCDDNTIQDFTDDNGKMYHPMYKIVVEGWTPVEAGDEVEVYWKDREGVLRGKGKVYNVIRNNYLPYSVIWV